MKAEKPPLGCKPAWFVAWSRIGELIEAIERHYESGHGDAKACEKWAEEIKMQCQIIEKFRQD